MPNLRIPRLAWDTIRFMLMVPFVVGMVLIELATGARRTETRISLDEGPFTFIFVAEIQRQGDAPVQTSEYGAHHKSNGSREDVRHDRQEGHTNGVNHSASTDQATDDFTAENGYHPMGDRSLDDESLDYDDSPTEEADDDYSEDDDSRPDGGPQLDKPAPGIDETLKLITDNGTTDTSSSLETQPALRLAPESPQRTFCTGRAPYMEPLGAHPISFTFDGYPAPVPFRQENEPPVMVSTMIMDENIPSQVEFPTMAAESKKGMPFAVMQANVFDLNEDSTETEGSGLEF